jgi:hypothetical protein
MPEVRAIDLLLPLIRQAPPWLVLAALVGLTSAAAFYVIAGRGFRSLPTYLVLGLAIAPLCQVASSGLPSLPAPLMIGEVHLAFVALGTWSLLTIARLLRL